MRYYLITITNPNTGAVVTTISSLLSDGTPNMSALNIEMDATTTDYLTPSGVWLRVWGIPLQTIAQASQYNGMTITVQAGMTKGLPLATAAASEAGVVFQGTIFQCFGNWQGVNMTLDFNIIPLIGSNKQPQVLVLNLKKGQTLASAITAMLGVAYPKVKVDTSNLNPNLVITFNDQAYFGTLAQFAQWLYDNSKGFIQDPTYQGAKLVAQRGSIRVFDNTTVTSPKQLNFNDLIGQITLIDFGTLSINCVMRGDLSVGDYIKLPPGQVTTTSNSYSQFRQGSIFTGVWFVTGLRHVGNFRQPGAESWITVVTAAGPVNPPTST